MGIAWASVVKFERLDKRELYQSHQQYALEQARKAPDQQIRNLWLLAAAAWGTLRDMVFDRCFCGRPAIGAKNYTDQSNVPYRGNHLHEALLRDLLARAGVKRDN